MQIKLITERIVDLDPALELKIQIAHLKNIHRDAKPILHHGLYYKFVGWYYKYRTAEYIKLKLLLEIEAKINSNRVIFHSCIILPVPPGNELEEGKSA